VTCTPVIYKYMSMSRVVIFSHTDECSFDECPFSARVFIFRKKVWRRGSRVNNMARDFGQKSRVKLAPR